MLHVLLPLLALSAAAVADDAARSRGAPPDAVSPAVRHRLDRADAALAANGQIPTRSVQSRRLGTQTRRARNVPPPYSIDLASRMRRLAPMPAPKETYKEFDHELMAKITAKNNALRAERKDKDVTEPYRRPPPDYLPVSTKAAKLQAHKERIARLNDARRKLHAKYAPKLLPART